MDVVVLLSFVNQLAVYMSVYRRFRINFFRIHHVWFKLRSWGVTALVSCRPSSTLICMSKYWGVSRVKYRGSWQWLAQKNNGSVRLWKTGFKDEDQATQWLAKKCRVTPASLRKSSSSPITTSSYKGVCLVQRSPRSCLWWVAQHAGKYIGTFDTEQAAAKAVARRSMQSPKSLRRGKRHHVSGSRGVRISAPRARALFKAAYRAFKTYVAGDYTNMMDIESTAGSVFKEDPSMILARQV